MHTLSSEMYKDLRSFGGIPNKEAARLLLTPDAQVDSVTLAGRLEDRPFLSKKIVHAQPGSLAPDCFRDFGSSSQTLFSHIAASLKGPSARAKVASHYAGPAALSMQEALASTGLDPHVYANAVRRISAARLRSESDRGVLYLHLFIACGCLQDPTAAALSVEGFVSSKLASTLRTADTKIGDGTPDRPREASPRLGLLRIVDGMARPPLRPLSTDPEGTIIGSLAMGESAITDVEASVSRQHLRIWREDGTWYAQGLGSTNGTMLVSAVTRERRVIELPRDERAGDGPSPVTPIASGDVLRLGSDTCFLVMALTE